jgi:Resolvase, N terminal domain/NHL repeat
MKENSILNKRVGIWIRVSTEDQAKGDSPEIHEARARAYALAKGWNAVEVYDLAGLKGWSGKTIREHPLAKKMLADIRRGHITGLIFSKLARLARNTRELLEMADEFRSLAADMISLQESIDTSTPSGRFFFTLLAAMSYDFTGDNTADLVTNSLTGSGYTYSTNGEYFPVVTVQTTAGTFSSSGGWNSTDPNRLQISVQSAPTQSTITSVANPVALKWNGTNLFVLSGSSGTITKFETNGTPVGTLLTLHAVCSGFDMDGAGNIYVALTASNEVWRFIPTNSTYIADTNFGVDGCIGDTNGVAGSSTNEFSSPFDVVVSPDGGSISVSDSGNNRIQEFSTNGTFIASFGSSGSAVGQFNSPEGLAYDSAGTLYIVDSGNDRIALAQDGAVVSVTGTNGTALGQFNAPVNINTGTRGVYVADAGNNQIQSFDPPVSKNLFNIDPSTIRFALTGFNQPAATAAIETTTNEMFYVADTGNNRVVLCDAPNSDLNAVQIVWNNMVTHVTSGDINGALSFFSVASQDEYRQDFLSVGTGNTISAINQIGTLAPSYIGDFNAEFYFTNTIDGQLITFPVEFDKENGVWKISEF